jgi:class 3 adenylate cyclase
MNSTNNRSTTYHPAALIATDRRQALHEQRELPTHSSGAVLFADIVGFTARLEQVEAQLGAKKGADVMTEQVNRLFTVLIKEVQRFAGVVVSFGGDSLTCWFAQAANGDAALQAVGCGLAMQQTMQGFVKVALPQVEPITFTLKVSIATGTAARLVVGHPHIQRLELLAGQVIARLATIQRAARAGCVLLDGESAKRLADRLMIAQWIEREGVEIGDIRGIKGAVQSQPVLSPLIPLLLPESLTKPWLLQPVYQRLSSGQGRFASELRSVVFLFLKFSGFNVSGAGESFDPQGLDRLDGYLCSLQQILHEHGGYLLKVTIDDKGSYLLASFGAPLSHEEDLVNRALQVALLLRKTSQAVNWIEQVQIAISQASVLAGIFGSPQRATFDLLGSEVNLLNRVVTHHAKAGQVVVTKIIQTQAHHQYQFGPAQQVEARGITGFVTIFELLAESTIDQAITLNRLTRQLARPLVGRQRERQKIEDLWQQAHLQQGQILLIEGAAGLGKSHLVADVLQELTQQHSQTLYAACERSSQYTPYHLWRLLLPQLFAQFDEPAGGHSDPAQRQEAIFAAVQQWIKQATQQQPLLLVLDDLHWIDEASRKLTVTLSRQLADWPVLLILLQRPTLPERQEIADQPPESPATRSPFPELSHLPNYHPLTLQELPQDEVEALLTLRLAAKPSPLLLSFLLRLTQGNPFFIDELLLTLQNVGVLQQEAAKNRWTLAPQTFQRLQAANCLRRDPQSGDWLIAPDAPLTAVEIGLPNTIERVIRLRIDALPEAARLTLKIASVVGSTFSHPLLAQIGPTFVDPTTLAQQLQTLVDAHLVVVDANVLDHPLNNPLDNPLGNPLTNNYTFRHHLTQEITYQTLMERERRLAHQAVGEALEQLDPSAIEALAEHYWQGDRGAKALIYLEQAAQRAQRSAANQAALNYYNRLLELEPKHIPSLKGKVEVLHVLGLYDEEENTLNVLSAYNIVHNELTDIEMGVIQTG